MVYERNMVRGLRGRTHSHKPKLPNILLVITEIGGGGAELVVANLCKYLDRQKFNVTVCHLKRRGERGDKLHRLGYNIIGLSGVDPQKPNYASALRLRNLVISKKIDLLHSHNLQPLFDCGLCKLLLPRVKLVHTFHYGNYPHLPARYLLFEAFCARIASRLVAVGYKQKTRICETYKLKSESIKTIYNGVEPICTLRTWDSGGRRDPDPPLVVGSICTFIEQKGLGYLLHVAAEMKRREHNIQFVVAGDGPLRPQIEKQKRDMGLDETVKLMGWVPMAAPSILPNIDIFLQTSLWEAMSMVILEAMSAAKPIVATDVGENKRIVVPARAGFIVPPVDVSAIVGCLETLITDRSLRHTMGQNARKAFRSNYTVELMARRYEKIYLDVLAGSRFRIR